MTTSVINFKKVTSVPSTPTTGNTVFFVALPSKPEYTEIYVSNAAGDALKRVFNEADVDAKILAAVKGLNETRIVEDIEARDRLENKSGTVYVTDASGDDTVTSGGAYYLYNKDSQQWVKVAEAESLDITLSWDSLTGKPTSTATAIDAAVANSHTHANKTTLDKLSDADGVLKFDGKPVMAVEAGW